MWRMNCHSLKYLLWIITCMAILFGGWMATVRWGTR